MAEFILLGLHEMDLASLHRNSSIEEIHWMPKNEEKPLLSLYYLKPLHKQTLLALVGLSLLISFLYRILLFKNIFQSGGFERPINLMIGNTY